MSGKFFAVFCLIIAANANSADENETRKSTTSVLSQVYVGMVYPSGNIYLKSFFDSKKTKLVWAPKVLAYPLKIVNQYSPKIEYRLYLAKLQGPVTDVYIPGVEGLDEEHNKSCGWKHKMLHKKFAHVPDFFSTIADHCETEIDVSRYTIKEKNTGPAHVIALDAALEPDQLDMQAVSAKRPVTPAEKSEIEKEKLKFRTENPNYECNTNIKYLDEAQQIVVIKLKQSGRQLRLSSYDNPGCAGHLITVWILDLLQDGQLIESQSTYHYQGAL